MWPEERQLLMLIREGKGPSDVAQIMGLNCPKGKPWHATKELNRAIGVARFFARHLAAVRKLYTGMLPLTRRETVVFRMFAVDRQTSATIAEHFGFRWRRWTARVLGGARKKLIQRGHHSVVAFLDESLYKKGLRVRRRRIMAGDDQWRGDVKKWLLGNCGVPLYVWGGQNLEGCEVDCSGLVLEVLKKFKVLPKNFGDASAQGLSKYFSFVKKPLVGDLAFFGKNWNNVNHVMFFIGVVDGYDIEGNWLSYDNCVAGMCGGKHNMSANWAGILGAALWVKTSPRYRNDFLGYRRVE